MFNRLILLILVGLFGSSQSAFAITIISQTDSEKEVEIEEAYRPASDKPGSLVSAKSFGYPSKKITIAAHSVGTIPLSTTSPLLLVRVLNKTKNSREMRESSFESYDFEDQQADEFNDDWGFVIHKPIVGKSLSFFDPNYWTFEYAKQRGYGIKCLHPLLLFQVTSLEELPEDLKMHFAGHTLF